MSGKRTFFRTIYISSVVVFCLISGFWGAAKAYENIRLIGFGEHRRAVEIRDSSFKFFDFEIELNI